MPTMNPGVHRLSLVLVSFLALGAALVPAASADTKLVMKSQTEAYQVMGQQQPAQDSEVTFWVGDERAARTDGDTSLILRPDQDKVYVVNHQDESYSALDLPIDLMSMIPEATREQLEPMMEMMKMTAVVEATDQEKEINGWPARLYDVSISNASGMAIDTQVWASTAIDVDLATFRDMSRVMGSLQLGFDQAADELLKIDGVPVLMESRVNMMNTSFESSEELVSASTEDAPAGTYEVPEGYQERPFNPMGQMQQGQ